MANDYDKARAMRSKEGWSYGSEYKMSKSNQNKAKSAMKKSPILVVILVSVIFGVVAGFFVARSTCEFKMNDYYVNSVKAIEMEYVFVDVSEHKSVYFAEDIVAGNVINAEDVYKTLNLLDKGVTIKFLGNDISNTISTRYLYREDISHDVKEVSKVDVSQPGIYYIEYTSSHFAFKHITLIRTIVVTGVELDG